MSKMLEELEQEISQVHQEYLERAEGVHDRADVDYTHALSVTLRGFSIVNEEDDDENSIAEFAVVGHINNTIVNVWVSVSYNFDLDNPYLGVCGMVLDHGCDGLTYAEEKLIVDVFSYLEIK